MGPHVHQMAVLGAILSGVMLSLYYLWNQRKHQLMRKKLEEKYGIQHLPYNPHYAKKMQHFCYRGCILPDNVLSNLEDIVTFEAREDDIYVVTYPKSGTTWMQEIVYLVANELDFEKANSETIDIRFPYLEFPQPGPKMIASYSSPRFIKSHLPYHLLPQNIKEKKCKIIYVARNSKDVIVSFFHFVKSLTFINYQGSFTEFVDSFLDDTVMYGPYWKHLLDFWERRTELNILFTTYEDMKKDLETMVRRVALFLDKHYTDKQINQIAKYCTFQNMKENNKSNYTHWHKLGYLKKDFKFMRKGKIGDWKNHFSVALNDKMDAWIKEHTTGTGLKFEYSQVETLLE